MYTWTWLLCWSYQRYNGFYDTYLILLASSLIFHFLHLVLGRYMLLLVAFWWCWGAHPPMLPNSSLIRGCFSLWGKFEKSPISPNFIFLLRLKWITYFRYQAFACEESYIAVMPQYVIEWISWQLCILCNILLWERSEETFSFSFFSFSFFVEVPLIWTMGFQGGYNKRAVLRCLVGWFSPTVRPNRPMICITHTLQAYNNNFIMNKILSSTAVPFN